MSGHAHKAPEEDHTIYIKVGLFFAAVIVGLFIIGMIN
jgi:hypothetical protein